uniref:Transposase n=1 Tax=Steinernema glaseri TaxID=37863 RepID=A0A1I7YEJ7_9BILA
MTSKPRNPRSDKGSRRGEWECRSDVRDILVLAAQKKLTMRVAAKQIEQLIGRTVSHTTVARYAEKYAGKSNQFEMGSTDKILQNFHRLFDHTSSEQAEQELYRRRRLAREQQRIERVQLKRMRKNQSPVWNPVEKKFIFDADLPVNPNMVVKHAVMQQQLRAQRVKEPERRAPLSRPQLRNATPSIAGPSTARSIPKPQKTQSTEEAPHLVPTLDRETSSKNAVIHFNGHRYELPGVPRERDGQKIKLSWPKSEPNLVYFRYQDDKFHSAVLLPLPKQKETGKEDQKKETGIEKQKKPALRLVDASLLEDDVRPPRRNALDLLRKIHCQNEL